MLKWSLYFEGVFCSLPLYSTVAVSFNYLWQRASWILIILSFVFPGAPHHSLQQHDVLTRSSPLHSKLIGCVCIFFLSSLDIFWESKVIISSGEDVGWQRASHASDISAVMWLSWLWQWPVFSHCVQSYMRRSIWTVNVCCFWIVDHIGINSLYVWTLHLVQVMTLTDTKQTKRITLRYLKP